MTRSVSLVEALTQKKMLSQIGHREEKRVRSARTEDAFPHELQFQFQDALQFNLAEPFENDNFIQPVDELGGEFAPGGFERAIGGALLDHISVRLRRSSESKLWLDDRVHLRSTEIASQEDHRGREIHLPVVTECQRGLI